MKLDLGGGRAREDGWLSLDMNPVFADVVASAAQLPFRDGSIEGLRAIDVLEHLSYRDTDAALAEWARVTMIGGRLFVQVPDADLIMRWYLTAPQKLVDRIPGPLPRTPLAGAAWRLLGGHSDNVYAGPADDWRWNAHYALFSPGSLYERLEANGWEVDDMIVNEHPNIQCWATRR